MKRLLWIGDAGCPSGFARATHEILDALRAYYDVTVLGVNYRGDPHNYPYPIYAAMPGGDFLGVGRLIWMCDIVKPDVIVIQNDGWNIQPYLRQLRRYKEYAAIPVVAAVAVDGQNFTKEWLDGVAYAIFWTKFALDEARLSGYDGPACVIPLGVDTGAYYQMDRVEARRLRGLPEAAFDKFIVGNVNRNQPRKRWDLTIRYFAKWVNDFHVDDAFLFLHTAPTGDIGFDVRGLMRYYGAFERLILVEPPMWYGHSEDEMRYTYNSFDAGLSTTQGEGFGLTAIEAMACGVPMILPRWSALGDWPRDSALMIDCTSTAATIGINAQSSVIGGVPDEAQSIAALQTLYASEVERARIGAAGMNRALADRFKWKSVGLEWVNAMLSALVLEAVAQ